MLEKVTIKGELITVPPSSMANLPVAIDLGGNPMLFVLDAKGKKSAVDKNKLTMKVKKGKKGAEPTVQFTLTMIGTFKEKCKLNGPMDERGNPVQITVEVFFDGGLYSATQLVMYK